MVFAYSWQEIMWITLIVFALISWVMWKAVSGIAGSSVGQAVGRGFLNSLFR